MKVVDSITKCRTSVLGGHLQKCGSCSFERNSYNSCRNRHCPKCQFLAKEKWIQKRSNELLPCPYYHVVFTVSSKLYALAAMNKKVVFDQMFKEAAASLKEAAETKLGANIGFIGIFHTWRQDLGFHPHVHFLVPAGGISLDGGKWVSSSEKFFLSVRVLSKLFRGKLLSSLEKQPDLRLPKSKSLKDILVESSRAEWVVYAKAPFSGPKQVIKYLGHYTHRIAISNYRIVSHTGGRVFFKVRDKENEGKKKVISLCEREFMRRFLNHVVPKGYTRIRHFGLLGCRSKGKNLDRIRELMNIAPPKKTEKQSWQSFLKEVTGIDIERCPSCKAGKMVQSKVLEPQTLDSS